MPLSLTERSALSDLLIYSGVNPQLSFANTHILIVLRNSRSYSIHMNPILQIEYVEILIQVQWKIMLKYI